MSQIPYGPSKLFRVCPSHAELRDTEVRGEGHGSKRHEGEGHRRRGHSDKATAVIVLEVSTRGKSHEDEGYRVESH